LHINTGLYCFSLQRTHQNIDRALQLIYGDVPTVSDFIDFPVALTTGSMLRRVIKPHVMFEVNQYKPFMPLPAEHAFALLEWGMNWCIAAHEFTRLILHSAVLVKNNKAIVFPAMPGSGKSTLTAFFSLSGWQLYSDEMAIIEPSSALVHPLYRPVCLKNNSIDLIKKHFPQAQFTPTCRDTQKGDVAHLKALTWHEHSNFTPCEIAAVVFPQYKNGCEFSFYQLDKVEGFSRVIKNAFNYDVMGKLGFETMGRLANRAEFFECQYADYVELSDCLDELVR